MWCQGMNNSGCGTNSCNTNNFCGRNNQGSCGNRWGNSCGSNTCGASACGWGGGNSCMPTPYSNVFGANNNCPIAGMGTLATTLFDPYTQTYQTSGCPLTAPANQMAFPRMAAQPLFEDSIALNGRCSANGNMG